MLVSKQDKTQELEHAKKILAKPEFYWNEGTPAGKEGSLRRARWIMQSACFSPGMRVLEAGCGTGYFSQIFSESGADFSCVDIVPAFVERAVARQLPRADFRVADVEALPFEDASFDAIVGVRILHHLDMTKSFCEFSRVLKKGGVIAFCEPNMMNPQIMIQKNIPWIKKLMGDTPDETAFFRWRLRKFLRDRGFADISVRPFDFLHPWIPTSLVPAVRRIGELLEWFPLTREIAGSLQIFARKI